MPVAGAPPEAKFPPFEQAALANGLKIILAERHTIPVVNFSLSSTPGSRRTSSASPGPPAWP